jgi:hypothetical protein
MLIEEFKAWADKEDISFFEYNDGKSLCLHFKGTQANFTCFLRTENFPRRSVVFESSTGLKIPEEHYFAISELICRMNFGLRIGRFDIDYSRGEILFVTSIILNSVALTPELIEPLVYINLSTHDRYYSCLIQLIFYNALPSDAIKILETTNAMESEETTLEETDEIDRAIQRLFECYVEPDNAIETESQQPDDKEKKSKDVDA